MDLRSNFEINLHNDLIIKSSDQLTEGLFRWPSSVQIAKDRASLFQNFQNKIKNDNSFEDCVKENLIKVSISQEKLGPLLRPSSETEKESYSQVCFTGSPWSLLNAIPLALTILSFYKSWIVPSMSIMFPLISFILPFIMLKAFFNIPITINEYMSLMGRIWNGQGLPKTPEELRNPPPVSTDAASRLKQIIQNGWTLFTLGQSLWQPLQQAKHFRKIDKECAEMGGAIIELREAAIKLAGVCEGFIPRWFSKWIERCPASPRQAFAFLIENPFWLRHTLRVLGRLDILFTLASRSDVAPCEFVKGCAPVLMLKDFGDPSIPMDSRVTSSICLGKKKANHHVIVTGPNKGGKSSFMRGVLTNVRLAHTFGCCFAAKAQMSYFGWIADGLRLDDLPGKESMFEREVGFAAGVLKKAEGSEGGKGQAPGLVLYDELFHSTNPPDATRASNLFCSRLWKTQSCLSIISTHVYSLAREAPSSVKRLCLASWKDEKGKYTFSYTVKKGICEVSSVDLLLKQFNML